MNKQRLKKAFKRILLLPRNKYLIFYLANKAKSFYFKIIKSKKVAYPSTVMIELTNRCNLACTTCAREYDYGKEMDKGNMTLLQAKKIIDELWPYLDSIGLTGMGETLLYKEIEDIVDYIKSKNKGIIISISTNANLPNFITIVSGLIGKIDSIQVSIDGLGEVYESIRKNAFFKNLDENLRFIAKKCVDSNTNLKLNMVVTKENYFQMHLIEKYAEEIGVNNVDFTLFNLAAVTAIERSYYDFYKSTEFLKALSDLELAIKKSTSVLVTNKNFKTDNSFQKCPFPWTHFYICWNGFVTPCCAKPFPKELHFGNVFDKDVIEILNSSAFIAFRKLWYLNNAPEFCNKCHFIDLEPIKY